MTNLNSPVSSFNFVILTCRLPQLKMLELLLCEESHLSIVADRCPNLKLLVLRSHPHQTIEPIGEMKSFGKFSHLEILDIVCPEAVPPQLSKLPELRELVLFNTHSRPLTGIWCYFLCKEICNSVRFLSLKSITAQTAEIILEELQLIVLRIFADKTTFNDFWHTFSRPRNNPKHFLVQAGTSYLWNGHVSLGGQRAVFRRRYLTFA